jgi:hypothetical protein
MHKRKTLFVASLLAVFALGAYAKDKVEYIYKLSRLSVSEVGVSCQNGGDPTVTKVGDTLIVSCGK